MTDGPDEARPHVRWLSQSAWGDYECCPRRYWHGYIDQTPPDHPTWRGWRFGRAVHAALEAAFRHVQGTPRLVGDDSSCEAARTALHKATAEENLDSTHLEEAEDMVNRSLAVCHLRGDQVLDVEAWLRGRTHQGTHVTGRADLVLRHDDGAVDIRDHKIARHASTPDELAEDRQLNLYAWMADQRWPDARQLMVSHHYPPLRRTVSTRVDRDHMRRVIAELDVVATTIAADRAFLPVPGPHCRTCRWAKTCPASTPDDLPLG